MTKRISLKLHHQFGHASANEHTNSCDTCIKLKRSPNKPAIGFPLATELNETVAVDLHQLEMLKTWFLHIIDNFTRFSAGAIIHSKKATVFVKKSIQYWISIFGAPRKLFSDSGGKFKNNEVHNV